MRKYLLFALFLLLSAGLTGCDNGNIFSWAHKSGASSSPSALVADGMAALNNNNYPKAIEYFQRAIDADPANSEAIYGFASAKLAEAGLDIGSLVANMVRTTSAPSRLAASLNALAKFYTPSSPLLPGTITANKTTIMAALDSVLAYLPKIAKGTADGKISPANADVNINLAFCYILRAGLRLVEVVDFNNDYSITVQGTQEELSLTADASARDIVNAYRCLTTVVDTLNLRSSASVYNIRADVQALFNDMKNTVNSLGYGIIIVADINGNYL